ncbi:MAG: hypothetical protein J7K62_01700 [Thermoplasmata archaeon]|nr:hypothetical protein [Thermoplasmata archaeon]
MKLAFSQPQTRAKVISKLRKICKSLRYEIIGENKESVNSLIIIGNGSLDYEILGIVCKHLNGKKSVGVIKPADTRIGVLKHLPKYLTYLKIPLNKILVIMDQEEEELNEVYENVERHLRKEKIQFNSEDVGSFKRYRRYECKLGGKEFTFLLVINGLDEIPSKKHCIEDHLIKAAMELKYDVPLEEGKEIDSKRIWKSKFNKNSQSQILRELLDKKSLAQKVLPQHFEALKLLE